MKATFKVYLIIVILPYTKVLKYVHAYNFIYKVLLDTSET